jgi:N-hydroxyarylamine O-acetyltransferase
MELDAYFERIGYDGPRRTDIDTFTGVHRSHLLSVPYENLEIQLGRENRLGESLFFDKIVGKQRGGWCYEMNGLLTAVLDELGFNVTRVSGAVARNLIADDAVGNHLVGLVDLEGTRFVSDVGLGDGPLEPFELKEGSWQEGDLTFALERLDDDWWRFHNHPNGLALTFDFTEQERPLDYFQPMCTRLQTDTVSSPFLNYAMAFRRTRYGARSLRDSTLIEVDGLEKTETIIDNADDYRNQLLSILGTDLGSETEVLWSKISARVRQRTETDSQPSS